LKFNLLLIALAVSQLVYGQHADSIAASKSHRFLRAIAAPSILIGSGLAVKSHNRQIQHLIYDADSDDPNPKTPGHISDVVQYAPIAMVYALTAMGNKGEHKILKATSLAIQSEVLMILMVRPLKYVTHETRPDGGANSFPSGHTAQAFMAATFLAKEYGQKSVWYSITGYTMATAVGMCRMMANKHWASDVLVGAGAGILSTNLVYMYHKHSKAPKINASIAGKGFSLTMKL
jgi:membrane-associated phospholipid phosphatase